MRTRLWLSLVFLACCSSACASNARWTFQCTEVCYLEGSGGGGGGEGTRSTAWEGTSGDKEGFGQLAMFACCLLLLPVAIDVVCLPVAVPHDLCFRE